MSKKKDIASQIRELLKSQKLAVLATQGDGQPYTSLMAYAFTDDLKYILLATADSTRKHDNIAEESRVALLVDNRSNRSDDFEKATALTIIGQACNIELEQKEKLFALYLNRHPSLKLFLESSSTVFVTIKVQSYLLVSRFEETVEYHF